MDDVNLEALLRAHLLPIQEDIRDIKTTLAGKDGAAGIIARVNKHDLYFAVARTILYILGVTGIGAIAKAAIQAF